MNTKQPPGPSVKCKYKQNVAACVPRKVSLRMVRGAWNYLISDLSCSSVYCVVWIDWLLVFAKEGNDTETVLLLYTRYKKYNQTQHVLQQSSGNTESPTSIRAPLPLCRYRNEAFETRQGIQVSINIFRYDTPPLQPLTLLLFLSKSACIHCNLYPVFGVIQRLNLFASFHDHDVLAVDIIYIVSN